MPAIALAPLAILAIALLAMMLLYALTLFVRMLAQLIPNWGIPGLGNIRSAVLSGINSALAVQRYSIDLAMAPIAAVWHWMVTAAQTVATYFLDVITDLYTVTKWVAHVQVPGVLGTALTFAQSEVAIAEAAAANALNTVHSVVDADIQALTVTVATNVARAEQVAASALETVHQTIDSDIQALTANVAADLDLAERYAQSLIASVLAQAQQDIAALATTVTQVTGVLTTDIGNAVQIAEGYADTAAGAAVTAVVGPLVTDVDNIIEKSWTEISDDVDATIGILSTDLPNILTDLRAIPSEIPLGLAGVAAISIPFARTVATYLRECGVPNCINLGQFGKDLQGLLAIGEDAAFIAFLVQLVHEPEVAGREVTDIFGPIISGALDATKELLSI